jgi:hypothetical protein
MDPDELAVAAAQAWRDDQFGDDEWHALYRPSSNVFAFKYSSKTSLLTVEYKGGTYEYPGTPTDVVHALATASSPGAYANANLKGRAATKV